MPKIDTPIQTTARIKVIGVGGSGKNALNHMINSKVKGVEFIAMNTDTQDLHNSLAEKKIHLGKNLTKGLGAGMNPDIGQRAAEETKAEIQDNIKGADMVFIACGMGGGTGTGAAPIVARAAREQGILTVAVATKPFDFEGKQRMLIAEKGLRELEQEVDAIIIIPNDRLSALAGKEMTLKTAFALSDEVLRQAVEGISDLISTPGDLNLDFADIKTTMSNTGSALMGIGIATGEGRATKAAIEAINSPLLDISINGAKSVLLAFSGGNDITLSEVREAARIVTESVDPDAKIIFGSSLNDQAKKGEIKITVIATGFPTDAPKKSISAVEPMKQIPLTIQNMQTPSAPSSFASMFQKQEEKETKPERQVEQQQEDEKDDSGIFGNKKVIHNSISPEAYVKRVQESNTKKAEKDEDDGDDDIWSSIPSFLKTKKND